jgi:hypothetical protein
MRLPLVVRDGDEEWMRGTLDLVAGDETRARAVLAEMQARLAQGPHAALGIQGTASASEIRSAFLQLTKTYHPTRFARMSSDVQRLSNEVFLALRGAHDSIAKPVRGGRANQSGMLPSNTPPHPIRTTGPQPAHPQTGPQPKPVRPGSRGGNDASGVRPIPAELSRPARMPSPSPPPQEGSEVRSPARAPTPATGIKFGGDKRPLPTAAATPPPAKSDDRELGPIVEMLRQQQWDAARAALNALAQRAPASTKIRALQAYQRGREAQLDRRIDEARVELDQALQLDPDLQLAKTALAELFTRRR